MDIDQKIFIAGSNGMVGSALKRLLIKKVYDNYYYDEKLLCPNREELNLLDFEAVKSWFSIKKPNIVIVAAAKVGGINANNTKPYEFIYENLVIQNNIIESSKLFGVKKLLFLGSSCIYPKICKQPIKEEYLLENSLEPTNQWYAIAKIAGLKLCEALNREYGLDFISLMPCNLYGVGDNYDLNTSHVIPALINKFYNAKIKNLSKVTCWGTGEPLREFLYVDDLAEACLFCIENWKISHDNAPINSLFQKLSWLNVGSGREITIKKLSEKIATIIGYKGDIHWDKTMPDGTPRKLLDISKIKSLGWEPKIKLEEGLRLAIDDFERNFYKANNL